MDNLSRLNESEESDKLGVFHILGELVHVTLVYCTNIVYIPGVFENILGFKAELSVQLVSKTKILDWLLNRIQSKARDENRGYAAEILSILLQNNRINRLELSKRDGVETMLKILSVCD